MSSAAARQRHQERRTKVARQFAKAYNFKLTELNNGYQLRIENELDLYPVNGRWCWLPTGERGDFETVMDIHNVMLAETDPLAYIVPKDKKTEAKLNYLKTDGFYEIGKQPNQLNIISVKAPKQMWARLLWAKIRGKR
jgi:hypothetical protein